MIQKKADVQFKNEIKDETELNQLTAPPMFKRKSTATSGAKRSKSKIIT